MAGAAAVLAITKPATLRSLDDLRSQYYVTLQVTDRPGVLAQVATVFGEHGVSIQTMEQKGTGDVDLCFILHDASHSSVVATLDAIGELDAVNASRLRHPADRRGLGPSVTCASSPWPVARDRVRRRASSAGLAPDGGLYLPTLVARSSPPPSPTGTYADLATEVMAPFVSDTIELDDFAPMVAEAYASVHPLIPDVCPVVELGFLATTCSEL